MSRKPSAKKAAKRPLHKAKSLRVVLLVVVITVFGWLGLQLLFPSKAAAPTINQTEVSYVIQNVGNASTYRYDTRDSQGSVMEAAKIIANPAGGYLAVYHTGKTVKVATSNDLKNWTFRANLDSKSSQPSIAALNSGGFVVVYETSRESSILLKFSHYPNINALYAARYDRQFTALSSLSDCYEGSPSISAATVNPSLDRSTIDIGFSYRKDCQVDRQATGRLTNFSSWTSSANTALDSALTTAASSAGANIEGNIGDRDTMAFGSTTYNIHEVQYTKNDANSSRLYLYNGSNKQAQLLNIKTHKGSGLLTSPSFSAIKGPDGSAGIVTTIFIPTQRAASGEAGELIYYVATTAAPKPTTPSAKPSTTPPASIRPNAPKQSSPSATPATVTPNSSTAPETTDAPTESTTSSRSQSVADSALPDLNASPAEAVRQVVASKSPLKWLWAGLAAALLVVVVIVYRFLHRKLAMIQARKKNSRYWNNWDQPDKK